MLRGIFRAYNRILDRDHLSDGPRENIRLRLNRRESPKTFQQVSPECF